MNPGIGPLFYSNPWVLRMQCKNVEKTAVITFYIVQQMHTQSFMIPQFLKIGLTHKNFPQWSHQLSQHALFAGERGEAHGCAFPKEERCAELPPTFICGKTSEKTEGNRSK